jgi:hypothetical protein
MKTKSLIIGLILSAAICMTQAQTSVSTNASGGATTISNEVAAISSPTWGSIAEQDLDYIEGRTNAAQIQVEAFGLRGTSTHEWGFGVNAYVPVGGTNSLFGAGIGFAYYDHNAYSTTLNAKLGGTLSLPVVKVPVYTYIESGGGYDISKNEAIAQAFAGFSINYQINTNWTATAGAAIGTVSDVPGEIEAFGGSVTRTF